MGWTFSRFYQQGTVAITPSVFCRVESFLYCPETSEVQLCPAETNGDYQAQCCFTSTETIRTITVLGTVFPPRT